MTDLFHEEQQPINKPLNNIDLDNVIKKSYLIENNIDFQKIDKFLSGQEYPKIEQEDVNKLLDKFVSYYKKKDTSKILLALDVASFFHKNQRRMSGRPYITHPFEVAKILADVHADEDTIVTALLHDTVEDTELTFEDIKLLFGENIALLVDGVTKLSQIELQSIHSKQAENFRKLILALTKDLRVLLVKLADRLHNMRTLGYITKEEKKIRIAKETIEIYAPLAQRIGIVKFSSELENLSFKILNPNAYYLISIELEKKLKLLEEPLNKIIEKIKEKIAEKNIVIRIEKRIKTPFSISKKMEKKKITFDDMADIFAIRIITINKDDCYVILGIIHQLWPMIHHEFDDYISSPKPNGYMSIHTTVLALEEKEHKKRQKIEIQIRTEKMHNISEKGLASHYSYKHAENVNNSDLEKTYNWAKDFLTILQNSSDINEAFSHAKAELYHNQVFCFTPRGMIISLPKGASALDFAYAVHSDIGNNCIGAKINNINMPLRSNLVNGDIVEIITAENPPLPRFWESMIITGKAKSALKRKEKLLKEKELVVYTEEKLKSLHHSYDLKYSRSSLKTAIDFYECKDVEELFRRINNDKIALEKIMAICYPGIVIKDNIEKPDLVNIKLPISGLLPGKKCELAYCCAPVPGERIIGINEKDKIEIHNIFCKKLENYDHENILDLHWTEDSNKGVLTRIILTLVNGVGVLSSVTTMTSKYEVDIVNIKINHRPDKFVDGIFDLYLNDIDQLNNLMIGLRTIPSVVKVMRPNIKKQEN